MEIINRYPVMMRLARSFRLSLVMAVVLTLASVSRDASAQGTMSAAAIVNDEVISVLDLAMRTRLVVLASGLPSNNENHRRLQPQVLRSLIDERLQLQEAGRLDVRVDQDQVEQALQRLANQNKMTAPQFVQELERNGILLNTILDQIRASLSWQTVVQQRLQPSIDIGEEAINEAIERLKANQGRPQYRVAEIFLAIDDAFQEEEVMRTARRLIEELRQGASFAALAQQFSQSATATVGGDLGWVVTSQLPPELDQTLARMRRGDVAGPIRTFGGVYILALINQRVVEAGDTFIALNQIFLPFSDGGSPAEEQELQSRMQALRGRVTGCDNMQALAAEADSPAPVDLGRLKLLNLPNDLRQTVSALPIGTPSEVMTIGGGMAILVVCSRQETGIERAKIEESLMNEQLDRLARRYMRDLRRNATVDLRL